MGRKDEIDGTFSIGSRTLICPFCEVHELRSFGHNAARCDACGGVIGGPLLETLCRITMTTSKPARHRSKAYWCGCFDGRFGPSACFTENRRLAEWDAASSRLDYYKGHRAGREARDHSSDILEAS